MKVAKFTILVLTCVRLECIVRGLRFLVAYARCAVRSSRQVGYSSSNYMGIRFDLKFVSDIDASCGERAVSGNTSTALSVQINTTLFDHYRNTVWGYKPLFYLLFCDLLFVPHSAVLSAPLSVLKLSVGLRRHALFVGRDSSAHILLRSCTLLWCARISTAGRKHGT